jgi:predicted permease
MAEAYGWGKFFGMMVPWIIDWGSRLMGIDVYGVESFYIPYFYAMSDQIGANVSGFFFLRRQGGSSAKALRNYIRHPVMLASLAVIFVAPLGLFLARILGFRPTTQLLTAVETIAANLCWVPPLIGWLRERSVEQSARS